ncbi:MAG: type I 3-dehydroquinate dehydratase [Prosthecobacter sp.]|uniref:type I 3-dehydroquinate dehydratase n=1 Tax=Prosthecobacter sp. TaxID=1965333 RepID=UPI0019DF02DA|nr:type I 3-dehydroquinate dehydratase [Prosthecobacter sp.]MBE2287505.1 type I 3-dehydroquinate dehydratase [Prosthecobacter sp.]
MSSRPLAVGVISDEPALEHFVSLDAPARLALCDVAELRLDLLKLPPADLRAKLAGNTLPLLLTARHPAEGGQGPEDPVARGAMIEPLLDLAALIDIELRSAMPMQGTVQEARAVGVPVVGSFHDFQATPADDVLLGAVNFGQQAGLDAVKIATYLNTQDDLVRLMKLAGGTHRLRLSVMGMGPWGRVSRLVLAKCGSLLNYGFIGTSNAPGQWPAARLKELLAEL